jgi:prepilin-type N-terminal cleavage/methylation domain-containing protein
MKRAFSLVEVLVCIAIVAIVAGVTYPVVVRAKDGAFKTRSISNMRQLHIALELYSQAHDGSATGTMEAMGLPPWPSVEFLGEAVKDLYPPTRPSPNWKSYGYNPIPSADDRRNPTWEQYTAEVGSSAVVIYDPFFNPPRTADYDQYWKDPFVTKFVMGMTVSGSLVKRNRTGHLDLRWWMD